jgi:hypothetical protein
MIALLTASVGAVTSDPESPIATGTPTDLHCRTEPTGDVIIFFLAGDTSHAYGSELGCPTLRFQQLEPLVGYFVEIDKTQLTGDQNALSLDQLRNDPGYVSEARVQWVIATPLPSPVPESTP